MISVGYIAVLIIGVESKVEVVGLISVEVDNLDGDRIAVVVLFDKPVAAAVVVVVVVVVVIDAREDKDSLCDVEDSIVMSDDAKLEEDFKVDDNIIVPIAEDASWRVGCEDDDGTEVDGEIVVS